MASRGARKRSLTLEREYGWVALDGVRKAWGEMPSATLPGDHVLVRVRFRILPFLFRENILFVSKVLRFLRRTLTMPAVEIHFAFALNAANLAL